MNFNDHSNLEGRHAFLSPSNYHWVNYDDQKLQARFISAMAARRGTDLHDFAHKAITLGIRLPKTKSTINLYVNDGIGYRMSCEVGLFYSINCFGHADTVSFRNGKLRISDLKNGISPTSHKQLKVYAALFCLEYGVSPFDIVIELRIYQRDEVMLEVGNPQEIQEIMNKIVYFDDLIESMKEGGEW
jgi:hypothetical protein